MAKSRMGIYGDPRGTTGGIVWGAARDRLGKVATTRSYVIPANPNTGAQQLQRGKFKDALYVVRNWGPSVYLTDWDRGIGQLPGFQSLMSVLIKALNGTYQFVAPADTPLGALHFPNTWTVAQSATPGNIDVTWSAELGADGTNADQLQLVAARRDRNADLVHPTFTFLDCDTRNGSPYAITGLEVGQYYLIGGWWQGAGTALGKLSRVEWRVVQAGTT